MKAEDLLDAIGETPEHFLAESERYSERPRIVRKWAVSAASLLLLTSLVLIPIQNGMLGCGATSYPEDHTHFFYNSIESFVKDVGKDSLLANLSYEDGEITDLTMECISDTNGNDLARYHCSYRFADIKDVVVRISFQETAAIPFEVEHLTLHGYDVIITDTGDLRTTLVICTDVGNYTVYVSGQNSRELAIQIADDLLAEE